MSKHVHLLIDKDNLVATGDGLTTSLTESLARNERFISHFLQNGNNGRIINICENCLQHVENSNQTEEDKMSRMLLWSKNICKRSSNLKLDVSATEVLLNRLQNNEKIESNIYALLYLVTIYNT
jgi:hypothetical protein